MHRPIPRLLLAASAVAALSCGTLPPEPSLSSSGASLALALQWPEPTTANAVFGAGIDSVSVFVYRNDESTAADTIFPWAAGDEELRLAVDIAMRQEVETVYVNLDLRAGQTTLYYAYGQAILRRASVPAAPAMPLQYIGPGYDAAFVTITPRGTTVLPGGTATFSASAQNGQQAIVAAPIGWSVSDTRLGTIDAQGVFTAKSALGTVRVRAITPTGIRDSVDVAVASTLP